LQIAKAANAFYPKATASKLALSAPGAAAVLSKADGLWVGGRVEISDDGIRFEANRLNQALNNNAAPVSIPMASIRSVSLGSGLITKIITVDHTGGAFRFRCFGAKGVVDEMQRHLASR
jgi:hypothetical protein